MSVEVLTYRNQDEKDAHAEIVASPDRVAAIVSAAFVDDKLAVALKARPRCLALDSSGLLADEALGAGFETVLGLASHHDPASYWNIIGRENPRRSTHTTMRTRRSPTQIEH